MSTERPNIGRFAYTRPNFVCFSRSHLKKCEQEGLALRPNIAVWNGQSSVCVTVTLDGFIAGPNEEMDWLFPGVAESQQDKEEFLKSVDTILLGAVAYEGLAAYWPDQSGEFADWMNKTPKIVFSKTHMKVRWGRWDSIRLIHENVAEEVKKLKQQEGRDMVLFAGANLMQSFTNLGLIDEYRLLVHPVVLGSGKLLFNNIERRHHLKLLDTKRYESGTLLLHYQLVQK